MAGEAKWKDTPASVKSTINKVSQGTFAMKGGSPILKGNHGSEGEDTKETGKTYADTSSKKQKVF